MEVSKTRPVSKALVSSSLFLSVICFAGLIHVDIELNVRRQMLQVSSQPTEEKLKLRSTAEVLNDAENGSRMKILHTDSDKGGFRNSYKKVYKFSLKSFNWDNLTEFKRDC